MVDAAVDTADAMQGFRLGYVQSDEASFFLCDYNELQTQACFDYNQSKVGSISTSIMTASFNRLTGHGTTQHISTLALSMCRNQKLPAISFGEQKSGCATL